MEHDIWNSKSKWNIVSQFSLKMLHPRSPHNRETHLSRYLAVQIEIEIEILVEHEFVPRNLSIWIWWLWGVCRFQWNLSYSTEICHIIDGKFLFAYFPSIICHIIDGKYANNFFFFDILSINNMTDY